jgi:hypothetical protein
MYNQPDNVKQILVIALILSLLGVACLLYFRSQDKTKISDLETTNTYLQNSIDTQTEKDASNTTNDTAATPTPQASVDTSWKNYENKTYGFKLTLGDLWKGYEVAEETKQSDGGTYYRFYVPTTDTSFSSTKPGFADAFLIAVYTLADWDKLLMQEGSKPTLIQKNDTYVFAYSSWQACPTDLCDTITSAEIKNIIKTFSLN